MAKLARPFVALAFAGLLLALVATLVLADTQLLNGKLRTGDTVTIPAGETVPDDVYLAGGTITVSGNVHGDLVALGGSITVSGTIDGDVIAAGGTVTVTGTVNGDVRVAGGTLLIQGQTGEDVVAAGGQLTFGGQINGDLIASGGNVSMGASVGGNVEASAGNYQKSGQVTGTEHVTITRSAQAQKQGPTAGEQVLDALRHFAALVIFAALAVLFVPRGLERADALLRGEPLMAFGAGIATFIGYVVAVIAVLALGILLAIAFGLLQVAAVAVISIFAAIVAIVVGTFAFVLAIAFAADLVVGLTLARLAMRDAVTNRWQLLGLVIAGALVVVIVTSLPLIGGVVKLVVALLGLGAIALALWRRWRGAGDVPPEVPSTPVAATPSA